MKEKLKLLMLLVGTLSILLVIGGCSKKESVEDFKNDSVEAHNDDLDENGSSTDEDIIIEDIVTDVSDEVEDNLEDKVEEKVEDTKIKVGYDVKELPLIEGGIKGVYGQYNMITGTCINGMVINRFSEHIVENYNSVTMENDMKPDAILNHSKSIAAGDIVVDYPQRTIDQLEWAKNNNLQMRGHVLVWYSQTPQWIFYEDFNTKNELVDRDTMLARMETYIKQNFELLENLGYIDIFYAYDIVNEAILDDGSLRDCLWKQIIGDDYIWYAFYYADKYAPDHVKLYYNDYNEQFKTEHIVKLAESLVDENGRSLIDGIGCQAHLYTKDSIDKYIDTLKAFSATGLEVQVTELDISLGTWQNILQPTV